MCEENDVDEQPKTRYEIAREIIDKQLDEQRELGNIPPRPVITCRICLGLIKSPLWEKSRQRDEEYEKLHGRKRKTRKVRGRENKSHSVDDARLRQRIEREEDPNNI